MFKLRLEKLFTAIARAYQRHYDECEAAGLKPLTCKQFLETPENVKRLKFLYPSSGFLEY